MSKITDFIENLWDNIVLLFGVASVALGGFLGLILLGILPAIPFAFIVLVVWYLFW